MTTAVYLDANALIEAVESEAATGLDLLRLRHSDGTHFATSEMTWAEVSMKPIKDHDTVLSELYEELIFSGRLVTPVPVDRRVLRKSAEVRAWLGGKLPDTIHIATAIVAECGVIVSSDRRLRMPHGLTRMSFAELLREGSAR